MTTATGEVIARFSTFDIVDRDGDIVRREAFTHGQTVPMVWAHQWDKPIGRGVILVRPAHAEFHGEFLNTAAAQEARVTVRELGDLQQWSFGFRVTHTQPNDRIRGLDITGAEVFEVSPVLVGANPQTATLAAKRADPLGREAALRLMEQERLELEAIELGMTGPPGGAVLMHRLSKPIVKLKNVFDVRAT